MVQRKASDRTAPARLHTRLTVEPLSVDAAGTFCADPAAGAVVVFTGSVRDATDGRAVTALEYEAFDQLAEAQLETLAADVAARVGAVAVWLEHRSGLVVVGEPSVVVGVSCAHRAEAFEGARHGIDTLKATVALWKRERFADGASSWVGHA